MRLTRCSVLFLLVILGCDASTSSEQGVELKLISGDVQSSFQFTEVAEPVRVRLTEGGKPLAGARLLVTATRGGGSVLNESRDTDASGELAIRWKLGSDIDQELKVAVQEDPGVSLTVGAQAQFLYTRPQDTGDGWETGLLDGGDINLDMLTAAVDEIRDGTYPEVHSLLIVKADKLVLEMYNPGKNTAGQIVPYSRTTPHEAQSVTKSFRSAMLGIAIDKGFIAGVEEPLFDFFPEHQNLRSAQKDKITLEDVLTMSTGLDWNEGIGVAGNTNTLTQMYSLPSYPQWVPFVLGRPMAFDPGTVFVYNTGSSLLLNLITSEASGMLIEDFVRTYWSDLVESADVPGIGIPLGGTILPRDMAKLGQVYLRKGMWKNTRVLSEEWINSSIQRHFPGDAGRGYGYQWWIRPLYTTQGTVDSFSAQGNGGQFIFVIPSLDMVIVFTGGNFGSTVMYQVFGMLENSILPALM